MSPNQIRTTLCLIWICFIVRCTFYSTMLPLWEGFDEWAHFGVAQQMSASGSLLIDRNSRVSREVDASLDLAPLPKGMTSIPPNGVTHDKYWHLTDSERATREKALRELPTQWSLETEGNAMPAYEASQPPLYYWLMAGFLKLLASVPLIDRLWFSRMLTGLLASVVLPLGYVLAEKFFEDSALALSAVAFVALAPGLAFASSRVSNESLSISLFSLLLIALLGWLQRPGRMLAGVLGLLLGLGLLTKAYFLTAIPAILLLYLWRSRQPGQRYAVLSQTLITFGIAIAIAGWWYSRNYVQTGTLSGLDEALMLRDMGALEKIGKALGVNWIQAIATILLSHVWYGGWSLLALPKWIYLVAFGLFAACGFGLAKMFVRSRPSHVVMMLDVYGMFWLGQLYHVAMLYLSKGSSTAMGGWYLYSLVWAEVALGLAGIFELIPSRYRQVVLTALLMGVCAVDVFGLHFVSIPYYAQSQTTWPIDLSRLLINKPTFIGMKELSFLWIGYLLSTVTIVGLGVRALKRTKFAIV